MAPPNGQHPTAASSSLFVRPSRGGPSGSRPPPPPPPQRQHPPPIQVQGPVASSSAAYPYTPSASGRGAASQPPPGAANGDGTRRSSGNASLSANASHPSMPSSRTTNTALWAMRVQLDLFIKEVCTLVEDQREEATANLEFPLLDPDMVDPLLDELADLRARDSAERRRSNQATIDRLTASLADMLEGFVEDLVKVRQDDQLEQMKEIAQRVVQEQLARQAVPSGASLPRPAAPAPPPPAPASARPDPALLTRISELESYNRQLALALPSLRAEVDTLRARLAPLEDAAQKSTDPRVRPFTHSARGSPALAHAQSPPPPPPPQATPQGWAPQAELDTLRGEFARLSKRVDEGAADTGSSSLGKRRSAEVPEGDDGSHAAKAQRLSASVEAVEQLGARVDALGTRIDAVSDLASTSGSAHIGDEVKALGQRVGKVEGKVAAVSGKVDQAAQDKDNEMDLERNTSKGLEKLERRLAELRRELDAEVR